MKLQIIKTIKELEIWMLENNIKNTYTTGFRYVTDEGSGLEEINGIYDWYHFERGNRTDISSFKSEEEAVQYVCNYLTKYKK
jgi:hypothetical protein